MALRSSKSGRRLTENIASLAIVQVLSYAVPLITVPYLVRVLQPAQFGLLSFAQGLVLCFDIVTDYGFNFSATRAIAAQRHTPEAISDIFWSTIYAKATLMVASAVVLALAVLAAPRLRETPLLYAASFLYVIGTAFFPIWLFQGLEQMKTAAAAFGAARLLTIPALFIWVRAPEDYTAAAGIQASVQVTATLLVLPILCRRMRIGWRRPSLSKLILTFKEGWCVFLSGYASYLCASSTAVILGIVAGKTQVGYYSAAEKLIKASTAILTPINQALYPHIAATKTESAFSALKVIRKSVFSIGLLALAASAATFLLARPACHLILGPSFDASIPVLQWLSPLPLLFGLASVFGTQTMLTFEMDSTMSRIMLSSAAIGIPLVVALSFFFGAVGAAAGSVVTAAFMVTSMVITLKTHGLKVWRQVVQETSAT